MAKFRQCQNDAENAFADTWHSVDMGEFGLWVHEDAYAWACTNVIGGTFTITRTRQGDSYFDFRFSDPNAALHFRMKYGGKVG